MAETIIEEITSLPAVIQRSSVLLAPVMDVNTALTRLKEFQEFCAHYLQESQDGGNDGGDYGVIPGTKKKTLFKSGADKLCEVYGLYDEYIVTSSVEDWDRGLFDYSLKCLLKSRRDDSMVGTGVGSCSTFESKYRWRDSQRLCPQCGQPAIIKGKDFNNTGLPQDWLCFAKKGGCGAKFKTGDKAIEGQVIGRVDNPDIIDLKNTALKMAKKRAKIDATIGVTRSSGTFAQDLDDIPLTPAPKPPPRVTTEDIEIGSPGQSSGVEGKGSAKAPDTAQPVPTAAAIVDTAFIGSGQAANLHKLFRDALKPANRKASEELLHDWFKKQGIVDGEGKPTALAILKANFYEVREAAIEHAAVL